MAVQSSVVSDNHTCPLFCIISTVVNLKKKKKKMPTEKCSLQSPVFFITSLFFLLFFIQHLI